MTRSLARTAAWSALCVLATFAGRLTIMDGTSLSLVWPAAGVTVLWFSMQRRARLRWVDPVVLAAITVAVNTATGAPLVLALWFVAANLTQLAVFLKVHARISPHLWGAGGDAPLTRAADLWRLLLATTAGALAGGAIGPPAVWLVSGHVEWLDAAIWFTRNVVSILLIMAVGLRVGHHWREGGRPRWPAPLRLAEYVALIAGSISAYTVGFALNHGLPLAFPLLAVTVWAALRLHTTFVAVHDLCLGTIAVLFTLHGDGPFATIASHQARALVAQAFVGMVAIVGLSIALGRDERAELLRRLTETGRAAAAQARLLTTIVDSMNDGVAVIRADGTWAMRNPASVALLGGVTSGTGAVAGARHYGLFHPDGTELTVPEMAHARAFAGEDVDGMELLVRNGGTPEGRILSVSARRLHGDDGVVVVFHDITAERRQRDELASFAGVVAHDLLNPLTTIDGWAENLEETLRGMPDTAEQRDAADSLSRIVRASGRMRHLINDLLAYTTTRNAVIAPVDLPLRDLVGDVTAARADLAAAAGTPAPVFVLGRLHDVHADPVLLRQLVDNLVGNAVKYTAPGVVPRIEIGSAPAGDGFVRVEISDNGIGIPAGQHEAIFNNFHRAHRSAGYAGTGLGLAICKRIVERHGGSIAVVDNPGGGSRFVFTMPAAGRVVHHAVKANVRS
ncbi:MASE1 domain-containing protein [Dactylosporangium aurantiacum]|uniref:Sensor-like histidine kinase SenX3 n=1 Tax=Dactylosporangium aurantiacum TaxID=35754 RepID=A0A9Q9IJN4_9ACTN|nr:ATP-binding protein [Dactylosporangium aurantiacum]MDG6107508.1 ATP-binding protein [Dactylosporangium aurantiacum]UWZ54298.1 MASE1 domain-containing protein [Dactylosporangium aurantiacum]